MISLRVLVIFTCFNRKEKTESCIRTLVEGNSEYELTFLVVDDNSTDGTVQLLNEMKKEFDIHILQGSGGLFYSGGMRLGMEFALENFEAREYDYLLMINDDVIFFEKCISKMINQSGKQNGSIVVGATCNAENQLSYSAIKYIRGIRYQKVECSEWNTPVDTFNANCVLIPYSTFVKAGCIDSNYVHSLGDFDYGLHLRKMGNHIYVSKEYVGQCENNSIDGTWRDTSLSRIERIKRKENIKGAPTKQWFYFLKKNFGMNRAIVGSITPFMRILIKK